MEKETMQGVATSINAGDKNVKLIRIVAEWWRSARYLQENKSRFEPNELEAFEYILNTPARGVVDEDKFGLSVTLIREISYQNSDQFGAEASNFAGKSGKILKDISEFAQTLESQRLKASADVNINHVKRNAMAASLPDTDRHNESDGSGTTRRRMINGNTWEGTFDESDNPYGSGIINYIDGSVYKGQWSAKGPHGNGTLVQEAGDIWEALFRDGKPVDGKIIYKNGNRYEGGLNENGRNGMGRTFTEYYEEYGQYEDDSRTGNGRITFKNGDFYEGGWNDKGPHGRGTLFDSVNKRTDTGDFINGQRSGYGRMVWALTNICYEGSWQDTPQGMEGTGVTYTLPNGARTPVRYHNGNPDAVGQSDQQNRSTSTPPYNPNVRGDGGQTVVHVAPSSQGIRNVIGIGMGVLFGLAAMVLCCTGELGTMLAELFMVGIGQLIFAGKFNPATGKLSRRVPWSPIALTGIIGMVCGTLDLLMDFSGFSILTIVIGIILFLTSRK